MKTVCKSLKFLTARCPRIRIVLLVISCLLLFVIIGLTLCDINFELIERNQIAKKLIISETSESYKLLSSESNGRLSIYLFNVTNMDAWLYGKSKPVLRALGPYVYRKVTTRGNFSFTREEGNRRYFQYTIVQRYFFERNESIGDHSTDRVIMPNYLHIALDYLIYYTRDYIVYTWFQRLKKFEYLNLTVEELLWGYEDPTLMELKDRKESPTSRGGLFLNRNNSLHGPFKIDTGEGNISNLGILKEYKGKRMLNNWASDYANMLNGTADFISPPALKLGDTRYVFGSSVCRSVALKAKQWIPAKNFPQLKVLNLELDKRQFLSVYEEPANKAFHVMNEMEEKYPPSGLWSMSPCMEIGAKGNEPIYMSLPFFYLGDDRLKNSVTFEGDIKEGLIPSFSVEPKTGILVEKAMQYQINVYDSD
ncbi:hypothetical protein Aperf_G00000084844 [Anoplocephala perfoliata]